MDIHHVLQQHWGYNSFRGLQQSIIEHVLQGRDTLALLPTGGGKSLCFQVPALCKPGICLVVSPLIALIKDQVQQLKKRHILALSIHSGMPYPEVKKTLQNAALGNYKFLYVSPERLQTQLFQEYLPAISINLLAIDEAHCISQWGYDFRPAYLQIATIREQLPGVPVVALTASATPKVQQDITEKLLFAPDFKRFQQGFERPNLSYSAFDTPNHQNKLMHIVQHVKGSAIVYCKSRKQTQEIAALLKLKGFSADFYHAGLGTEERNEKQNKWIANQVSIMVCTNAFGMGIDKPDVRLVIHYGVPDCLENYYQEAGRAGRDGKKSYAVLLYSQPELNELKLQVDTRFPNEEQIRQVYFALMNCLQVPAGSGEGNSYDFDLLAFSRNFNFNLLTATYALKAIEQEGFLMLSESVFLPATVVFKADRQTLQELLQQHPQCETVAKGLLRSYEGIFDYPVAINENALAKFVSLTREIVLQQLKLLHQLGIIEYAPQKDNPQIYLLRNRMFFDGFHINLTAYQQRKLLYQQRIEAMLAFATNTIACRSQLISQYFHAPASQPCGICDNCINHSRQPINSEEFLLIQNQVKHHLAAAPQNIEQLLLHFPPSRKQILMDVIEYLIAEEICVLHSSGDLQIK